MLGFLTRSRLRRTSAPPPTTRLRLEELERRDCPAAPVITSFNAVVQAGHSVLLSGSVTADQLQGVSITFSGAAAGCTATDAAGNFSFSTQDAILGTVYAVGTDQQPQTSSTAQTDISTAPPSLTLNISYGTQRNVTLSGLVSSIDPGGLTVTFSGVVSGSTTTATDGTYSYMTTASALGTAYAITVDAWGQSSLPAQVTVASNAPAIQNFHAIQESGNMWTFSGTVSDESPGGLTVRFGGLASLEGKTTTVAANGSFASSFLLQTGEWGTATAQTTDWWGLDSNIAPAVVA